MPRHCLFFLSLWLLHAQRALVTGLVTVRVGVEPENTCLDEEVKARLRHRNEVLNYEHKDARVSCRRHRERCDNWYCSVTEAEYHRSEHSFRGDGTRLFPTPCLDVKEGAALDGFWGYCAAVSSIRSCRYLVVLREPVSRVIADYARYCSSGSGSIDGEERLGFMDFARRWDNHYTRLFAHSGLKDSPMLREGEQNRSDVTAATLQRAVRHLQAHGVDVIVVDHRRKNTASSVWPQLSELLKDHGGVLKSPAPQSTASGTAAGDAGGGWCGVDSELQRSADAAAEADEASARAPSKGMRRCSGVTSREIQEARVLNHWDIRLINAVANFSKASRPAPRSSSLWHHQNDASTEQSSIVSDGSKALDGTATTPLPVVISLEKGGNEVKGPASSDPMRLGPHQAKAIDDDPNFKFGHDLPPEDSPTLRNWWLSSENRSSAMSSHLSHWTSAMTVIVAIVLAGASVLFVDRCARAGPATLRTTCSIFRAGVLTLRSILGIVRRCSLYRRVCSREKHDKDAAKDNPTTPAMDKRQLSAAKAAAFFSEYPSVGGQGSQWTTSFDSSSSGSRDGVGVEQEREYPGDDYSPMPAGAASFDDLDKILSAAKLEKYAANLRRLGYAEPRDLVDADDQDLANEGFKVAEVKRLKRILAAEGFGLSSRSQLSISKPTGADSLSLSKFGAQALGWKLPDRLASHNEGADRLEAAFSRAADTRSLLGAAGMQNKEFGPYNSSPSGPDLTMAQKYESERISEEVGQSAKKTLSSPFSMFPAVPNRRDAALSYEDKSVPSWDNTVRPITLPSLSHQLQKPPPSSGLVPPPVPNHFRPPPSRTFAGSGPSSVLRWSEFDKPQEPSAARLNSSWDIAASGQSTVGTGPVTWGSPAASLHGYPCRDDVDDDIDEVGLTGMPEPALSSLPRGSAGGIPTRGVLHREASGTPSSSDHHGDRRVSWNEELFVKEIPHRLDLGE